MASKPTRPSASSRSQRDTAWLASVGAVALACSLQAPSEGEVFADPQHELGASGAQGASVAGGAAGSSPGAVAGGGTGGGGQGQAGTTAGQAGDGPAASGLIAHFAFEDTTDTARNQVDATKNASYHGMRSNPAGVRGKALALRNATDAATDWLALPEGLLSRSSEVTLSLWVRDLSTSRSGARLFEFSRGTGEGFYFAPHDERRLTGAGARLRGVHGSNPFVDLWTDTPLTDKEWHHVAVRWSATRIELFIDARSAGSADPDRVQPLDLGATSTNWLGRASDDSAVALYGEIDELKIFDRSLKTSEIAALYADR